MGAILVRADEPLSLDSAVRLALEKNRDLVAARFAIEQAEGRLSQAGQWPNPEIEISHETDVAFENEGESNLSTGFRQRFPVTGRLAKARTLARVDVAQAIAEVRNEERLLAGEVLARSRELLVLQQQLQTNQEIQDTLEQLVTVSEQRAKAAEGSATDVNLARLELQKTQLTRELLLEQQELTTTTLKQLLGREPQSPLQISGRISGDFDASAFRKISSEALARRPDRQLAVLGIRRAAAAVKLVRAEKWEDWTAGVDYARDAQHFAAPIGHKVDQFFGLSVSVPLPLWNRNQGRIAESQATQARSEAELRALDLRIETEVRAASDRLQRLSDILREYRDGSLVLARQNVALAQKGYGDGLVSITAVIQAQQQFIELRLGYLETLAEFERALTDWQTAVAVYPRSQPRPKAN
jgi:cobalt-zinc-cadmium efflux system outer membrane protein